MIMEPKKSHDVQSAGWRPRKADGLVQSKCKGLRTKAGGRGGVGTDKFLLLPFVLSRPSMAGMRPPHTGWWGHPLYQVDQL